MYWIYIYIFDFTFPRVSARERRDEVRSSSTSFVAENGSRITLARSECVYFIICVSPGPVRGSGENWLVPNNVCSHVWFRLFCVSTFCLNAQSFLICVARALQHTFMYSDSLRDLSLDFYNLSTSAVFYVLSWNILLRFNAYLIGCIRMCNTRPHTRSSKKVPSWSTRKMCIIWIHLSVEYKLKYVHTHLFDWGPDVNFKHRVPQHINVFIRELVLL